jgi:hypothetical protein
VNALLLWIRQGNYTVKIISISKESKKSPMLETFLILLGVKDLRGDELHETVPDLNFMFIRVTHPKSAALNAKVGLS